MSCCDKYCIKWQPCWVANEFIVPFPFLSIDPALTISIYGVIAEVLTEVCAGSDRTKTNGWDVSLITLRTKWQKLKSAPAAEMPFSAIWGASFQLLWRAFTGVPKHNSDSVTLIEPNVCQARQNKELYIFFMAASHIFNLLHLLHSLILKIRIRQYNLFRILGIVFGSGASYSLVMV